MVTVVIPNRNYGHFLGRALASIAAQTMPAYRVLVVDSESVDNSRQIASDWNAEWISVLPTGQAHARNVGIAAADTEFIIALDADDWIAPTYIERCLSVIGDAGVVAPDLVWPNGRIQKTLPPFTPERFLESNLMFCGSLFRKKCWQEVGGYFTPRGLWEDWLFWAMISSTAWQIVPLHEPLFHYMAHPTSDSSGVDAAQYDQTTRQVFRTWLTNFRYQALEGRCLEELK